MKTTATRDTVLQAINRVNKEHGYRIELNRDEQKGKYFFFTLRSEKSGIPGSRVSASGKKLISASWHAHGYVYEQILDIDPDAVIKALDRTIDINGGNWEDWNCGNFYNPVYMSQTSIF